MKYVRIRNVSKPVSRLLFGTAKSAFPKKDDYEKLLDEVVKAGVNTFDTARAYGGAERLLGDWMESRGNRESVVILSKGGHPALFIPRLSERQIRRDLLRSCRELKTDFIDVYLLHRDDTRRPAGEFVEWLNALHAEGKIGAFGGSNWTHRRIEEANEYAYRKNLVPFAISSPYFGLADMKGDPFGNGAVSISGAQNAEARAWYAKTEMPVCAFSALGRGFFSGRVGKSGDLKGWARRAFATKENFERLRRCKELAAQKGCSTPQLALAWLFSQKMNILASVSASTPSRIRENVAALEIELTEAEKAFLDLK